MLKSTSVSKEVFLKLRIDDLTVLFLSVLCSWSTSWFSAWNTKPKRGQTRDEGIKWMSYVLLTWSNQVRKILHHLIRVSIFYLACTYALLTSPFVFSLLLVCLVNIRWSDWIVSSGAYIAIIRAEHKGFMWINIPLVKLGSLTKELGGPLFFRDIWINFKTTELSTWS